jgi:hypothetical protein
VVDTLDRLTGVKSSLSVKLAVRAKSTGNLTLFGFQTIDGVAVADGDETVDKRVLVGNQTDTSENGIYDVGASTWSRSADFDGAGDITDGVLMLVRGGNTYANTFWRASLANPISLESDAIAFTQVGANGSNGTNGTNGIFNGTEGTITARTTDLVPLQDASNSSTAARATAQSIAETARHSLNLQPFLSSAAVTTGAGAGGIFFPVPSFMDGFQVVAAEASHKTQGSGGSPTSIQVQKNGSNIFGTALTIDVGETNSGTAATTVAISTASGVLSAFDVLTVDVNVVPSSTAPKGLVISLTMQRPATT